MQVYELIKLTEWFEENVKGKQIPNKYEQLFQVISQNANARNNQPQQPFETQKEALLSALSSVSFDTLSIEQINLLEILEIKDLLRQSGVEIVEDILFKNVIDIASAATKIQENTNKFNKSVTRFEQFKSSFSGIFEIEEIESNEDNVFMRIYFQGDSSINNISDLKKLSSTWYDIGRGIAMANDCHPEDFHVIGAQKGSVVLELAVAATIATTLSSILLAGLKVAEKVLDVLKKAEELKAMKLQNKKIATDLIKEAEQEKKEGIETIVKETIEKLGIDTTNGGDKIASLEKAVKNLVGFTENGGKIDFIQPTDQGGEKESPEKNGLVEFRKNCTEIRKIERKINYIEHKAEKSEDS